MPKPKRAAEKSRSEAGSRRQRLAHTSSKRPGQTVAHAKGKKVGAQNPIIVNMIPKALSFETNQDSEPTIAVNPANPLQIAASAFTPDPGGGNLAPIYVSTDGGNTWVLNSIVPSDAASGSATADITVAFSA